MGVRMCTARGFRNLVYGFRLQGRVVGMDEQNRAARRAEIEAVAYRLLAERGYAGMSMLAVAKAVGASNETLYRWYGDKPGLVRAMIATNAADVLACLEAAAARKLPLEADLRDVGAQLLALMVGERAVALHRAAAGDASGDLGREVARGEREVVAVRLAALLARHGLDGQAAAACFLALLLGDWPMARAIGAMGEPDAPMQAQRLDDAVARMMALVKRDFFRNRKDSVPQAPEIKQFSFDL